MKQEAEQKTGSSIRKVLEGVKTQAKHIKDTVTRLEKERDEALSAKNAATRELEVGYCSNMDIYCLLVSLVAQLSLTSSMHTRRV